MKTEQPREPADWSALDPEELEATEGGLDNLATRTALPAGAWMIAGALKGIQAAAKYFDI